MMLGENSSMKVRFVAIAVGMVSLVGSVACGPNPHDVYLQAMNAQTVAEKGACKLVWDNKAGAHLINSTKLEVCVHDMEIAHQLYLKARAAGATGRDIDLAILKIEDDVAKVRSMMRNVAAMELENQAKIFDDANRPAR